jgi:UDP-N-acetylglucosamine transferase subunit ALG13
VIFVTVGTDSTPFDRLLSAADELDTGDDIIVQCGPSLVRPRRASCVDFLSFDRLVEHVQRARLVITHAGVGSIMVCLAHGKSPIVVPRLVRFGEAVDDHQLTLARRLAAKGVIRLVEDARLLPTAVREAADISLRPLNGGTSLTSDLRAYLRVKVR